MLNEIEFIKKSTILGFDTEFKCNDNNEDIGGVSIIQFANENKKIWIIDVINLNDN